MFFLFDFRFFLSAKIPGKIHCRPDNKKNGNTSDKIKVFSEDGNKNFKKRVFVRSVKEEKVCIKNFVKEKYRNTFTKKKQKNFRNSSEIRTETAGKK